MQNAKDTFYLALRNRLANLNPARTITLAGVSRPGILVQECESPTGQMPSDVFVLRWSSADLQTQLPAWLESQACEICYWTRGSDTNADMDRGRLMTEMDAELAALLQPANTQKLSVSGAGQDLPMNTNVFWLDAAYSPLEHDGERLSRTTSVQVFSLQETLSNGGQER